jgi:hypothetical protein
MDHSSYMDVFAQQNPGMSRGPAPPVGEAATFSLCGSQRVTQAGGALANLLMHPSFVPMEQLFRKLPQEGVFTATPQRNFRFELGAFTVPQAMAFALVDYRFQIYRPSGAAPGDFVPLEDRRLSTHVRYDVNISEYRKGNLRYELEPSVPVPEDMSTAATAPSPGVIAAGAEFNQDFPPQIGNPVFPPSSEPFGANADDFAAAAAAQTASTSGVGLSALPQRVERQGPLPLPFTMVVSGTQRVAFDVIVVRGVPIPLGFFEVGFTGVLLPANDLAALYDAMKPCDPQGGRR